jgi:hypothetical protein
MMINILWLIPVALISAFGGFVLAALMSANGCEDCRAKYKQALRTQYEEIKKGDNNKNA